MGALHLRLTPWLISDTADATTLARQGELAESWGYRSFWLPEHHFSRGGSVPEPLMLLAAVAARTRTILLGTTFHGTNASGERQRPGAIVPWAASGVGPQAKPKAPAVGHLHGSTHPATG